MCIFKQLHSLTVFNSFCSCGLNKTILQNIQYIQMAEPQQANDKVVSPPAENTNIHRSSTTVPRKIVNPDDRLLLPPPPGAYDEAKEGVKGFGQKVSAEAHELAEKAKKFEKGVETKVGQVRGWIQHDWLHFGIAVGVIGLALHAFSK